MLFWAIAAAMTAAAVAFLLHPLVRHAGEEDAGKGNGGRADWDMHVYRDQLDEVERDLARGVIGPAQAEAARAEVGRRMLAAADARPAAPSPRAVSQRTARLVAGALAAAIPLGALALYVPAGRPDLPARPFASRGAETGAPPAEVLQALDGLNRHLEENPGDLQGWMLTAQVYDRLGRFAESAEAYRKALAISQGDPSVASSFGEALVRSEGGLVGSEARRAFEGALERNPGDARARYYLALARAQAGDDEGALERWAELVRLSPADAPWMPTVRQHIAETAGRLGRDVAAVMPEPLPPASGAGTGTQAAPPQAGAAPGPTREQMEAAGNLPPEERREMIRGMVERLAARLEETPEDAEGWLRLSRAYGVLGEPDKAEGALSAAVKAAPDRPDVLSAYAEALLADVPPDAPPPPEAVAALRKVLAARPDDPMALYVLGLDAAGAGRPAEASEMWERLLAQIEPGTPRHADLRARIEALRPGG
jgi:cytochrome c-type biogenesis protein CcmH